MDKNDHYNGLSAHPNQSDVSEASSKKDWWPKWLTRYLYGNKSISSKCPYCDFQAPESVMVQHLQQCQQVTRTITRPDGSMASITYAGPRNDIKTALRQGAFNDGNDMRDQYGQLE